MSEETWVKQYWRPAIAWQYFSVCLCDFIIFPAASFYFKIDWDPITLQQSGFYHMSMAAIIGVTAWTRGQEKLEKLAITAVQQTTQEGK